MAAIPASALIEQFAGEITPAGQAVFGLNAQPFENDHGAHLGEVHDSIVDNSRSRGRRRSFRFSRRFSRI